MTASTTARVPRPALAAGILLLALLPSLLYAGHWSGASSASPAGAHDHAAHCHEQVAGCSQQPLPLQVAALAGLLAFAAAGGVRYLARGRARIALSGPAFAPPTRPPIAVA